MSALLKVENLNTSFFTYDGEVKAVRDVSFFVEEGESLGIVGESGSGKSVTSLSILQLLSINGKVTSGSVWLKDQNLIELNNSAMRKIRGGKISMIFQDPMSSLNPVFPVGDQVSEILLEHEDISRKAATEKVLELFRLVQIPEPEKRYHNYPHEYSGGMRQRAMIAMALACKPSLLIADEPTTALDVTIQDQILKLLRSLQEEMNMSIIFITHDLGVVAEICSRVMVMYGGMVMESANVETIFNNPKHPYTMGLLKSISKINQDRNIELQPIPGSPPDMSNPPTGCPFNPRCAYARKICTLQTPECYSLSDQHISRCWLLDENAPTENNPFKQGGTAS
jgi:oligopeptide transport system ATP-binding protein